MKIKIETVGHKEQRYNTCGDWIVNHNNGDGLDLTIRASKMGNQDYEFLVALHELVEAYLCLKKNITDEEVTKFDVTLNGDEGNEPGDNPTAPYVREHCIATGIERIICAELNIPWKQYDDAVKLLC